MITAPDVFAIEQGNYTPTVRVDWLKDRTIGVPAPLHIGRTLRYSTETGWEVAGTRPDVPWKPLARGTKGIKTVKTVFDEIAPDSPEPGYYELVGPGLAGNPHQLETAALKRVGQDAFAEAEQPPRTSLFAYPSWFAGTDHQGVLWIDTSGPEPRFAAVRREHMKIL